MAITYIQAGEPLRGENGNGEDVLNRPLKQLLQQVGIDPDAGTLGVVPYVDPLEKTIAGVKIVSGVAGTAGVSGLEFYNIPNLTRGLITSTASNIDFTTDGLLSGIPVGPTGSVVEVSGNLEFTNLLAANDAHLVCGLLISNYYQCHDIIDAGGYAGIFIKPVPALITATTVYARSYGIYIATINVTDKNTGIHVEDMATDDYNIWTGTGITRFGGRVDILRELRLSANGNPNGSDLFRLYVDDVEFGNVAVGGLTTFKNGLVVNTTTGDEGILLSSALQATGDNQVLSGIHVGAAAIALTYTGVQHYGVYVTGVGGAGIYQAVGIRISDVTSAANNYALMTGQGRVAFGDRVDVATVLKITNGVGQTFQLLGTTDNEILHIEGLSGAFGKIVFNYEASLQADAFSGSRATNKKMFSVSSANPVTLSPVGGADTFLGFFDADIQLSASGQSATFMTLSGSVDLGGFAGFAIGLRINVAMSNPSSSSIYGIKIEDLPNNAFTYSIYTGVGKLRFGGRLELMEDLWLQIATNPAGKFNIFASGVVAAIGYIDLDYSFVWNKNIVVTGSITPAAAYASALLVNATLTATANGDTLKRVDLTSALAAAGNTSVTMFGIDIAALGTGAATSYGLRIGDISGTTPYAIYTGVGIVRFGDDVYLNGNDLRFNTGAAFNFCDLSGTVLGVIDSTDFNRFVWGNGGSFDNIDQGAIFTLTGRANNSGGNTAIQSIIAAFDAQANNQHMKGIKLSSAFDLKTYTGLDVVLLDLDASFVTGAGGAGVLYGIKIGDIPFTSGGFAYSLWTGTGWARFGDIVQFTKEATGSGSATLGSNCPVAGTPTPVTWLKFAKADGTFVYVPAYA